MSNRDEFTVEDVKAYEKALKQSGEVSDDELDYVAGGKKGYSAAFMRCPTCRRVIAVMYRGKKCPECNCNIPLR